jgi:hypothetical protein
MRHVETMENKREDKDASCRQHDTVCLGTSNLVLPKKWYHATVEKEMPVAKAVFLDAELGPGKGLGNSFSSIESADGNVVIGVILPGEIGS